MSLNAEQARADRATDGRVLGLSEAGTGKTRLLVEQAAGLFVGEIPAPRTEMLSASQPRTRRVPTVRGEGRDVHCPAGA